MTNLLEVKDLCISYGSNQVLSNVSFELSAGPFGLGIIGESGSGKTTLARALLKLQARKSGEILFDGVDIEGLSGAALLDYRRAVQLVFQDGDGALNPRMTIGKAIAEPMLIHHMYSHRDAYGRVNELLDEVGLPREIADRYPHQTSGGQRQRIIIARALSLQPRLVVLDEPTSALDMTVQARILELIQRLRNERKLSYLLISHNLGVVDRLCEESLVLYRGYVLERGKTSLLLDEPIHPYTQALRTAVPEIGLERLAPLAPKLPTSSTKSGCPYVHRCPLATMQCIEARPNLVEFHGRQVACHRLDEASELGERTRIENINIDQR